MLDIVCLHSESQCSSGLHSFYLIKLLLHPFCQESAAFEVPAACYFFFSLSTPVIERLSDALHPVLPRGEITAGMYANGFSGCESFASLLLAAPLMALLLTVSTLLWQRAGDRSVLLTEENRRPPRAASSEGNKPVRQNTWPALASEPREEARGLYKLLSVSEPPELMTLQLRNL